MPNIRTYETPALGLQPTTAGVDARAQAARRISSEYNEVADATQRVGEQGARAVSSTIKEAGQVALDYMSHREISHGAAAYATLNDRLTNQWNETAKKADPNDPTVAAKFRQEALEPELEKYRDGFMTESGQKFAESHIASLRNGMFEKTASDMATLAASAVSTNMRQTGNSLSNSAMTNPESVPRLLASTDSLVEGVVGSSPNLKGAVASKARMELTQRMKEDIVKSGAIGAIQNSANPEAEAERWGKQYPEYINGNELKMLSANARQQIRADRTDKAYSDHIKKQEAEAVSDATETKILQKLYSDDPRQQAEVSTKAIVNDPGLTRVAKERMISVVNREMKPETAAKVSNDNAIDLLQKLRLPEGEPGRISDLGPIYQARIDGKLNRTDFEALKKEFTDLRTPEGQRLGQAKESFLKAMGPIIDKSNPLMGNIDPDGKSNLYRLQWDLDARMDEYRKAGKNPYDLLDPSKPDYMGRPEAMGPYQKTLQKSLRDQARRLTSRGGMVNTNLTGPDRTETGVQVVPAPVRPAAEPRKSGETPEQYLKRTGRL